MAAPDLLTPQTARTVKGMRAHEITREWRVEPTLADELRAFGDDDVVEMANLQEKHTGIPGVVFISTSMGAHGPRVKYFAKTGGEQPSFSVSISDPPSLASSLAERDLNRYAPRVIRWVMLNRGELLRFWSDGKSWSIDEVAAFATRCESFSSR
jgi:hypothetical protein